MEISLSALPAVAAERATMFVASSRRRRKRSMAGGPVSCRATRMGHSRRADTGSANSKDPAARRCTGASTRGPATYYIGIDVSMKDTLF